MNAPWPGSGSVTTGEALPGKAGRTHLATLTTGPAVHMAKLKRTKREALRTQRLAAERSAQAEATLAARQQQAA